MIAAVNKLVDHEGRQLAINCEDLGFGKRTIVIRVFEGGGILWEKTVAYETELEKNARAEAEQSIRAQVDKLVDTVRAGIAAGRVV